MNDDAELMQSLRSAVEHILALPDADISTVANHFTGIADLARDVSPELRRRHPSIPWSVLVEMRAVIRRAAEDLDRREITTTLRRDMPELHRRLAAL